jgi:hypothetical protein
MLGHVGHLSPTGGTRSARSTSRTKLLASPGRAPGNAAAQPGRRTLVRPPGQSPAWRLSKQARARVLMPISVLTPVLASKRHPFATASGRCPKSSQGGQSIRTCSPSRPFRGVQAILHRSFEDIALEPKVGRSGRRGSVAVCFVLRAFDCSADGERAIARRVRSKAVWINLDEILRPDRFAQRRTMNPGVPRAESYPGTSKSSTPILLRWGGVRRKEP